MLVSLAQLLHAQVAIDGLLLAATKRGQISTGFVVVLIAITLTVSLAVTAYYFMRGRTPSVEDQSRSLFKELCRAHQLTGAQSTLLMRLGRGLKLACPATLFIDSTIWRIPVDNGPGGLDKKDWDKLQIIQKIVFTPASVLPK